MAILNSLALAGLLMALVQTALAEPSNSSSNVCSKFVAVKRIEMVDEPITYEINYAGRCGIFPCTKTRKEVRIDSRPKVVYDDVQVNECCPGYHEDQAFMCQPVCLKGCGNGRCVEPEVCECQPEPSLMKPGYTGAACNMFTCLEPNKWGAKCDKPCAAESCSKNAYCNAQAGKCVCRPGWRGEDCAESCKDSGCNTLELPTMIETELNVIRDIESAPLKLEPDGPEKLEPATPVWSFSPQLELNIFLLSIIVCLVVRYRKQIRALKDNIYYAPSTGGSRSSGGSSVYSAPEYSVGGGKCPLPSSIANRPLVPIPTGEKSDVHLSFDSATRSAVYEPLKPATSELSTTQNLTGTKHEKHLQSSHQDSRQNIYLDAASQNENFYTLPKSPVGTQTNIAGQSSDEDSTYKVPNSPTVVIKLPQEEAVSENEVIYEELPFERNEMRK